MNVKVIHMVGPQIVIGRIVPFEGIGAIQVEDPFEVWGSLPDVGKVQVTLVPYGSLYGQLPSISPKALTLFGAQHLLCDPVDPPTSMVEAYEAAVAKFKAGQQ